MRGYSSRRFTIELPPGHRFPMHKYARLEARVCADSGAAPRVLEAPRASIDEVRLAHEAAYVDGVLHGRLAPAALRRLGLPWSPALVERSLRAVGATLAAARAALADGVAVSLAGSTHHANAAGGADAFRGDALGRLGLSMAGLRARDELVLAAAASAMAGVAVVMGGGHAADIDETVAIHAQTVVAAAAACARH